MINLTASSNSGKCKVDQECKKMNELCINGSCIQSMTRFHDAVGTGLSFDYELNAWKVVNISLPSWTNSLLNVHPRIRIFKKEPLLVQTMELLTGGISFFNTQFCSQYFLFF
jgi:hypothetical protein